MLAPLQDYLYPENPRLSQLLSSTKICYSTQLSVYSYPGEPGFEEARWITSEDANIKRLLNVFASGDMISDDIWDMCADFMHHLYRHKPQLVVLGPMIEGLPDNHPSKPQCLFELSMLLGLVGNHAESKRLNCHSLKLCRERGSDLQIAQMLIYLSDANKRLGLNEEGILQVKEAFKICERLRHISGQTRSLKMLAWFLSREY